MANIDEVKVFDFVVVFTFKEKNRLKLNYTHFTHQLHSFE